LRAQQPQGRDALHRLASLGLGPVLKEARDANRTVAATGPAKLMNAPMSAAGADNWGIRRHSAIATAAFARMRSAKARVAVSQILADAGEASLGSAAAWADNIKDPNPPSDPATRRFLSDARNANHTVWHYVNLPLGVERYDPQRYPSFTREDDVVQMLLQAVEALVDPRPSARFEPINALRLVAHLVGDLHQPVHVGCGYVGNMATNEATLVFDPTAAEGLLSDRGGNQIKLPEGARSLHSFWDSTLGANSIPAEADYVPFSIADVREVIFGWVGSTLVEARKAYQGIRISSYVPNSKGPQADDPGDYNATWEGRASYEARCGGIVGERMSAAASNLAALLDAIWPE
jgi:hypothetical protein